MINILIKSYSAYILLNSVFSSILKIISLDFFFKNTAYLLNYRIKDKVLSFFLLLFIGCEFFLPLWLLFKMHLEFYGVLAVIIIYLIATLPLIGFMLKEGDNSISCGCYGSFFQEKITFKKVLFNFIYILILTLALKISNPTLHSQEIIISLFLFGISLVYKINKRERRNEW